MKQELKRDMKELFFLSAIFIVACIGVQKASFHNGRLNMCDELGKAYTYNGTCVECVEVGRKLIEGHCEIVEKQQQYYSNINFDKVVYNGTIS